MQIVEGMDEDMDLTDAARALSEPADLLESSDDAPIIRLINALLTEAIKENASDIHIEPFEARLTVRFRVDGVLREVLNPPRQLAPRLISRVKVMAKLDIAEKRVPQDGRISVRIAGRPVDAYVGAPGCNAGYTLAWPTEVANAEFMVDRLNSGATIGSVQLWRHAENLRRLWEDGHDPVALEVAEAQRLGIDHWIRLSMNDWHHWGADGAETNLQTSRFYDRHPEYLIGAEGAQGWSGSLAEVLPFFQDFAPQTLKKCPKNPILVEKPLLASI